MEQKTYTRIPMDRIGALIGRNGRNTRMIESTFNVELVVDSKTGKVEILVKEDQSDASVLLIVKNIVNAIGRGFNPWKAMALKDDENSLLVLDLENYVGQSKNAQNRVKGRIIGKQGKSRKLLEELTECHLSVYGGTVGLIGAYEALPVAKKAVEMLLNGSFHKTVWNHLYAYRRKMKKEKGELWYTPPRRREKD